MTAPIAKPIRHSTDRPPLVLLSVSRDNQWITDRQLEADTMVIIGSSDRCGLSLAGQHIAGMHCCLRRDEAGIWLSDWESDQGTLLDGNRVTEETQVQPGSNIQVGGYTIQIRGDQPVASTSQAASVRATAPASTPEGDSQRTDSPALFTSRAEAALDQPPATAELPPVGAVSRDTRKIRPATAAAIMPIAPQHPEDRESLDMLRAEVEQLQYELAERDAQLAELMESGGACDANPDATSNDQLLSRIEQLLAELDRSDTRMLTLEELLVAAEEANRAEREERVQLESWVADIESLIAEHDTTRNAETAALEQQVAALTAQRDQLMQALSHPASEESTDQAADAEEVARLRAHVAHLGQQLQDANAAVDAAREQLKHRETQLAETADANQTLREQHLQLAEERAAVARLRAELTAQQAELPTRPVTVDTDVDSRVRGFRQHLREIHEEEKQQHNSRRLSTRIAQLWKRVEHP